MNGRKNQGHVSRWLSPACVLWFLLHTGWLLATSIVVIPSSSGTPATVQIRGQDGIQINATSGVTVTSSFFLIDLGPSITVDTITSNTGQPLTLDSATGEVRIAAGDTVTGSAAMFTTLNVTTGTGSLWQGAIGMFTTLNVSNGFATNSWNGLLGNLTTLNVSNAQATGTWAGPVGMFTTLNVSNGFATNSLNGLLGNITTLNTTDTRATNSTSAKVGFVTTMNVTEVFATLAMHAPTVNSTRTNATGPSGAVSATLVLGVTGNVSQMFSDTTTTTTCQAPPSGNVSLTLSGSALMPTVRVSRNNYIVSDGLDVATLGAGSLPTGNTTLGAYVVDNTRGNSPFFGTRQGFGAPERFYKIDTTGPFTVASKVAFTQIGVGISLKKNALTTGGRIHFQGSGRVGVKGTEGIALCVAAGVGAGGSGSGTGGTAIVGTTALAVLDSRTTAAGGDVSGNYIAIDFDAVLLAAPSAATNVRGGGFAALQSNSADANGSLQVLQGLIRMIGGDVGDTIATPDLSSDTLLALEVKWTSTSATNSLKLSREEWSLCQPQ